MECIFCKGDSTSSQSSEHIIPESLGNTEHTLPIGVVCDGCNNYFGRKVEGEIQQSGMIRLLKAERRIPNKQGNVPSVEEVNSFNLPEYRLMSRFVGKVGLEALADRLIPDPRWKKEVIDKTALDPLREYTRYDRGETWPFLYRTIYPVNAVFEQNGSRYEVLHEYDLLYTKSLELHIVLILFGVEFALNLGGRSTDGYKQWLEENDFVSPLYSERNA